MKTSFIKSDMIVLTASLAVLAAGACHQLQHMERKPLRRAEAKAVALQVVPGGTVKESELEKENGKLVWSFDIAHPCKRQKTEVHVDAYTGHIVGVENEISKDKSSEAKIKR